MISESVEFLRAQGKRVVYDAEHFFDGYADDPQYALRTLRAAAEAGAETICLCDTNGGTLPLEVETVVREVVAGVSASVGIHCPQRWRLRRRQQHRRSRRRGLPGAGHDQRLRRALRQRQPRLDHPGPGSSRWASRCSAASSSSA